MKTTKRRGYHHGDLRDALVQGAMTLLATDGLEKLSLRRVAALLGVSQSALYSHFRDKDALLAAVAAVGFERLRAQLLAARPVGADQSQQAVSLARAYIGFALDEPALFQLMFRDLPGGLAGYPLLATAANECLVVINEAFNQPSAVDAQAHLRAAAGWAQIHGFAELLRGHWLDPQSAEAIDAALPSGALAELAAERCPA